MMDIYSILPKYFSDHCSVEEKQLVEAFKLSKPKEFAALELLWQKEGIDIIDFDNKTAWQKVLKKSESTNTKKQSIFRLNRSVYIATAIAAILILGVIAIPQIFKTNISPESSLLTQINNSDSILTVTLPDSSIVWLNQDAKIEYASNFSEKNRNVILHGEAFFEVKRNEQKPFIVETKNSKTEVLGTSFNIDASTEETAVTVATGKVRVSLNQNESIFKTLLPGDKAIVNIEAVISSKNTDDNYRAWKTGKLVFNSTSLTEVVLILNKHFNDQIQLEESNMVECSFTSEFDNAELSDILDVLQVTCQFEITQSDANIIIK